MARSVRGFTDVIVIRSAGISTIASLKSKISCDARTLPQSFKLVLKIIEKYAKHFAVKIEQLSVQHDHVHLLIRTSRRRHFHYFFRVVAGQIAQSFEKEGLLVVVTDTPQAAFNKTAKRLWKYRPFSRVVRGWRVYKTVRDYIQLNEWEVLGKIRYQKNRLRALSSADWQILWV